MKPTNNKPLEVSLQSNGSPGAKQKLYCYNIYTAKTFEWKSNPKCLRFKNRWKPLAFYPHDPRGVGATVGGGSGSGACLRSCILIFMFRSVQTEQISRRDLEPDKLIKKKQTSRAKAIYGSNIKQVFASNITWRETRTGCLGNTSETIIIITIGRE